MQLPQRDVGQLQREGVVGVLDQHQPAVRQFAPQQLMALPRREEVVLAIHEQHRAADLLQARRQRLEGDERFHQVLQGVQVVADVAGPHHRGYASAVGSKPRRTHVHRIQDALQVGQADLGQPFVQHVAQQLELRRELGEAAHHRQPCEPLAVPDREVERDHAAEADAGQVGTPDLQVTQQGGQEVGMLGQVDAQHRLGRLPLAEHVVRQHPIAATRKPRGVGRPQVRVLSQAVRERDERQVRIARQCVADALPMDVRELRGRDARRCHSALAAG